MKLLRLTIEQFRCFKAPIVIEFADLTCLIGRNDAGKSSVMDALDIFLNDNVPDKDDATKGTDGKGLAITCEFCDLPSSVIIDDSYRTSLADEFLLNVNRNLEIRKTYSGNLTAPKLTGVFARAIHPSAPGTNDLIQLKRSELKTRASELHADVSQVDQKINAELRRAIRTHVGELNPVDGFVPLNENNAKDVWAALKSQLPAFALFKSDRPSTDQDPEAQDPLRAAVKEAIKEKQPELEAIAAHVVKEVEKIAAKTVEKLREMDPTLASELKPQFAPQKWDTLFKASFTGDDGIPVNKRGSGVKRLILLNFFRAKAEQQAHTDHRSQIIYGIEEPETSQHPDNQRMLLRALAELSAESQVVFTTHTPMLVRVMPPEALRYIRVADDGSRDILVGSETTNRMFAKALGVLPDHGVKLFVAVEGPNDIAFLQNMSRALIDDGVNVPDLEQMERNGEVIFFPLGGSTLALWTSRLAQLNRPEFHLYDRDTAPPAAPKSELQVEEINRRVGCRARSTASREMENYVHWECIREAYAQDGTRIAISQNFGPYDDVPAKVAELVQQASTSSTLWSSLDDEGREEKMRKAKGMINRRAAKLMTRARLVEIDPHGDVLAWFEDIRGLIEGTLGPAAQPPEAVTV